MTPGATAYDLVAYPSGVFPQTHPDRLATLAALHGLAFARPGRARVLEIGCGDGTNLIAMAALWPEARFTGFDLAASAIARGQAMIDTQGLANVRLEVLDILDAAEALGNYDYVVAHGIYAWVDTPVRDALMALIGKVLAADGVAYVSYNALPGGHIRRMVRDMLLAGLRGVTEPQARIARARSLLRGLADAPPSDDPGRRVMQVHCKRLLDRAPGVLFHDELGEVFEPAYLEAFAAHAARFGLQFLNEAGFEHAQDGFLPDGMEDEDVVNLAQAGDFADVQYYRQSLLVRAEARPSRRLEPDNLSPLFAAMDAEPLGAGAFKTARGGVEIADPTLATALEKLAAAWPARIEIVDLLDDDARRLALFDLCVGGVIQLHVGP